MNEENEDLLVPNAVDQEIDQEEHQESANLEADETVENEEVENTDGEEEVESHDDEEEADEDPESEEVESHDDEEEAEDFDTSNRKRGVEKRINKLTKQKQDALREAEYWKKVALEREQAPKEQEPKQEPARATVSEKPTLEEFGYDAEKYTEALTEWTIERKEAAREAKAAENAIMNKYNERIEKYEQSNPDYRAAIDEFKSLEIGLSPVIVDVLLQSEVAPEMEYHLATNPDFTEKLNKMSPQRCLMELGKLESKCVGKPNKPIAEKQTKAPKPIKQSKGITSPKPIKSIEEMTFAEYEAYEMARKKK